MKSMLFVMRRLRPVISAVYFESARLMAGRVAMALGSRLGTAARVDRSL